MENDQAVVGEAPSPFATTQQLQDFVARVEANGRQEAIWISYEMAKQELHLRAIKSLESAIYVLPGHTP